MDASFMLESPIPNSMESLVVSTGITTLNPLKYTQKGTRTKNAASAFLTVETADIRFTVDGSTPVSGGNGHRLLNSANQVFTLRGMDAITKFKVTREGGADSKVNVTYFYA